MPKELSSFLLFSYFFFFFFFLFLFSLARDATLPENFGILGIGSAHMLYWLTHRKKFRKFYQSKVASLLPSSSSSSSSYYYYYYFFLFFFSLSWDGRQENACSIGYERLEKYLIIVGCTIRKLQAHSPPSLSLFLALP